MARRVSIHSLLVWPKYWRTVLLSSCLEVVLGPHPPLVRDPLPDLASDPFLALGQFMGVPDVLLVPGPENSHSLMTFMLYIV